MRDYKQIRLSLLTNKVSGSAFKNLILPIMLFCHRQKQYNFRSVEMLCFVCNIYFV